MYSDWHVWTMNLVSTYRYIFLYVDVCVFFWWAGWGRGYASVIGGMLIRLNLEQVWSDICWALSNSMEYNNLFCYYFLIWVGSCYALLTILDCFPLKKQKRQKASLTPGLLTTDVYSLCKEGEMRCVTWKYLPIPIKNRGKPSYWIKERPLVLPNKSLSI